MLKGIRDLTALIAIAFWLFLALPLIYLDGGPDEMIEKMEIRDLASVFSVIVATVAALVAWESIRRQTRTQKWLANHQLLMKTNDMIIADPSITVVFLI
jgi:hypothetical protein